jgi:hypothetical protein
LPTRSPPLFVQVDPAPVTVAVPVEPGFAPMKPTALLTVPPSSTFSVPVPLRPTERKLLLAQVEPVPVTVAVPVEPTEKPT